MISAIWERCVPQSFWLHRQDRAFHQSPGESLRAVRRTTIRGLQPYWDLFWGPYQGPVSPSLLTFCRPPFGSGFAVISYLVAFVSGGPRQRPNSPVGPAVRAQSYIYYIDVDCRAGSPYKVGQKRLASGVLNPVFSCNAATGMYRAHGTRAHSWAVCGGGTSFWC